MDVAPRHPVITLDMGRLSAAFATSLRALESHGVIRRIWDRDGTVWKPSDDGISDRLGWLEAPWVEESEAASLKAFARSLKREGFRRAVVLGMGGSSLAAEVFARMFPTAKDGLELEVLDTTEPATVAEAAGRLSRERTLFIASSKSGTTAELVALLAFFREQARKELGQETGSRFVAITDPGTPLEAAAVSLGFRRVFAGRPDVGGRFSALTVFGLLPAALKGLDIGPLLASARDAAFKCRNDRPEDNPGAFLGAALGTAAAEGSDKMVIVVPERLLPFAAWLEQLVAESTGKDGRGILPVIEGADTPPVAYGKDVLSVFLEDPESGPGRGFPKPAFEAEGPTVRLRFDGPGWLGAAFFIWEFAVAVACHILKVNAFDQPDVESTKRKTKELLSKGMPGDRDLDVSPSDQALAELTATGTEGSYLAVLAFLPPRRTVEDLVNRLAGRLRERSGLPVTTGFGPRYLHSTGQLHKGGPPTGRFLILLGTGGPGVPIPEIEGLARPAHDFASLFSAQARGDFLALKDKGRPVRLIEVSAPAEEGLERLIRQLG